MEIRTRVGIGFDAHKLVDGRDLVLGGVHIPFHRGLDGHSDADVLVHALMDAMLGAAGLGDIGRHFPDTDPHYKDADSINLLKLVINILKLNDYRLVNADITLVAEKPKVAPHIHEMTRNLEGAGLPHGSVNIKATRGEGMGFVGREEGMAAMAVAMVEAGVR